jgi:hypothetical protein
VGYVSSTGRPCSIVTTVELGPVCAHVVFLFGADGRGRLEALWPWPSPVGVATGAVSCRLPKGKPDAYGSIGLSPRKQGPPRPSPPARLAGPPTARILQVYFSERKASVGCQTDLPRFIARHCVIPCRRASRRITGSGAQSVLPQVDRLRVGSEPPRFLTAQFSFPFLR